MGRVCRTAEQRRKQAEASRRSYYKHHERNKARRRVEGGDGPRLGLDRKLSRRAAQARRRARAALAQGTATTAQIAARIAYYGGRCWMCGNEANSIDHVIPLADGGSNWPSNLRPACMTCNSRKGKRRV